MSLQLVIPQRVALQQSSPPLHQPSVILKEKRKIEKEEPLNCMCANAKLSQQRGSPHKHVPFLGFGEVQNKTFHNVVAVDTYAQNNAFIIDIGSFIADPQKHPLAEYMFYSPHLDDNSHDPTSNPQEGIGLATCISHDLASLRRYNMGSERRTAEPHAGHHYF
jgi:hypothetical protein